jgi:abequosyltransferase
MFEHIQSVDVHADRSADSGQPLLSVCIATHNRARYLGQTLDNILEQCGDAVEVVVVDGASTDDSAAVVEMRAVNQSNLKYYPQATNSGIDGDFDKAVELAQGRYCWLASDDDMLAPDAVARVLNACRNEPDAVIIDAEVRTADLVEVLVPQRLGFCGERRYVSMDSERLFIDCGLHLNFIGALVIRRELWLQRERKRYYGSEFIHVGVLFQAPLPGEVIVIGAPLVRIRYGVGNWTSRSFQVWMFKWPALIWSFDWLAESSRATVSQRYPWQNPVVLLLYRAKGWYSWQEFTQLIFPRAKLSWRTWLAGLIALLPGRLVNLTAFIYASLLRGNQRGGIYDLKRSRFFIGKSSRG